MTSKPTWSNTHREFDHVGFFLARGDEEPLAVTRTASGRSGHDGAEQFPSKTTLTVAFTAVSCTEFQTEKGSRQWACSY